MKLLRRLPVGRSYEQLLNHYEIEKSIAEKLKTSNREVRSTILSSMYDEIFTKVPDHPRLTKRNSEELSATSNKSKLPLISKFMDKSKVFVEFAPGDCRFSLEVAEEFKWAYGVDISDQRHPNDRVAENFELILYDGYNLDSIEADSVDVVFSDQLIEHFHEDDTRHHYELVHRILRKGGRYVFRTPHILSGPHDISKYFSYEPEGFHLKEWTYSEMGAMLKDVGYSEFQTSWNSRLATIRITNAYFYMCEYIFSKVHKKYLRGVTKFFIPTLCGVSAYGPELRFSFKEGLDLVAVTMDEDAIRRATRLQSSAEDKIRIVMDGLRGEDSIAELCGKDGIARNPYFRSWSYASGWNLTLGALV